MKDESRTVGFAAYGILILFVLLLIFGLGSAHGQNIVGGGGSVQAPYTNQIVMPEHPQHASQHPMGTEQSLLGDSSAVTIAHGERPLWECYDLKIERPLGDVAREYRDAWMHPVQKAIVILEK